MSQAAVWLTTSQRTSESDTLITFGHGLDIVSHVFDQCAGYKIGFANLSRNSASTAHPNGDACRLYSH